MESSSPFYVDLILGTGLLPFMHDVYPDGHRFLNKIMTLSIVLIWLRTSWQKTTLTGGTIGRLISGELALKA